MKNKLFRFFISICVLTVVQSYGQTNAFTYEGRLAVSNSAVSGVYDLRFGLCDNGSNGNAWVTVTNSNVSVTSGLFSTPVNFGYIPTNANPQWLELAVRPHGSDGDFVVVSPRQLMTPAYSAFFAYNASNAFNFNGTLSVTNLPSSVITNGATGVTIQGTFAGNGAGLTNIAIPDGSLSLSAFGSLVATNWTYFNSNESLADKMVYSAMKHVWTNNCLLLTLTNGSLWNYFGLYTPFGDITATNTDHVYMSAWFYTTYTNLGLLSVINGTNSAYVFRSNNIPANQWVKLSGYYTAQKEYGNGLFFYITTNGYAGQYLSGTVVLSNIVIGTYTNYSPFASEGVSNSDSISYDSTSSGLNVSNVQSALDSLVYPWAASNVNVIVDGDSKGVGLYYNLITSNWWKSTSHYCAAVGGVSLAYNTNAWATNTASKLSSTKTNLYVLWTMHNDVKGDIVTELTMLTNHLAQVAASNANIVAVTTQPRAGYGTDGVNQYLFLRTLNNVLRTSPYVWRVVDAEAIMPECYNANFYVDTVHGTTDGIALVANEVTRQVCSLRKTVPPALWCGVNGTNVTMAAPVSNGTPGLVAYGNTNQFHFLSSLVADNGFIAPSNTPSSSSAPGIPGQVFWDANYIYVCVGTNTWKRVQLTTW